MYFNAYTIFPFLGWFRDYRIDDLKYDIIGGLTVALVLIPQSMAYAQLAGLPPLYGLYAASVPPIVAALFGSSRQLATGPVAVVSLMTAVALEPLAAVGTDGFIAYAVLLAFMVGIFQFTLGVFRLGLLVNFLSHPVVNGFTNAAAIIIATSQLSEIFGVQVDSGGSHYGIVMQVIQEAMHYTHLPTLLLGGLAFAIMFVLKRSSPKAPYVLVAVVITTTLSWLTQFERSGLVRMVDIKWPEAVAVINAFNTAVDRFDELSIERNIHRKKLDEAKQSQDLFSQAKIQYDIQTESLQLDQLQIEIRHLRHRIRRMHCEGVVLKDGRLTLYPKGRVPQPAGGDRRTWRFVVGNHRLDSEGITLTAGGDVVGIVPQGLPELSLPRMDIGIIVNLIPYAVIISFLGFMEAISIAKAMSAKTGHRIDPNQELIGQGLGNIFGSVAGSYPTSGSFSRSAVNLQSGAVTGLSNVITGLAVVVVLVFFTPLLYHLPQSVLAAIIMMAVVGLININGIIHAWRAKWYDGAISLITFITTLGFAPHLDKGILVGVALSVGMFLYKSMRPTVVDLSLGLDRALHDAVAYGLRECLYIDVVRFDGPLFFANASYLEDQIRMRRMTKTKLRHIIIVANGINDIDVTGEETLSLIVGRLRSAGIGISLSGVNESVAAVLNRTHLMAKIGKDHIYPNMNSAIAAVHKSTHKGGEEAQCPLTTCVTLSEACSLEEGS